MASFNWTQLIPGVVDNADKVDYTHVATLAGSSAILIGLAVAGRAALGSGDKAVMPSDKVSIKGIFELITEFIVDLAAMVIGENGRKFAPLFASIFFFIFINNVIGLIPGMTPATENMNTTLAIGVFSFIAYNIYGFKEHGPGYLKQLLGPKMPWYLFFVPVMMLFIETVSHVVRPVSLALRLQGNMFGDHMVLGIALDLVPILVPVIAYGLGLFVCFMQAFVFTMLSMIYVSMAISHDH